jgi:prepilin peptidase dependent protein B
MQLKNSTFVGNDFVKKQQGFNLIEFMIALTLGLLLLLLLLTLSNTMINSNQTMLHKNSMVIEMEAVLNLIMNDIRRAGYSSVNSAVVNQNSNNLNVFMQAPNDISINNAGSCILFTYDRNKTGSPTTSNSATAANNDHFGYRLNSTTNAIEVFSTDNTANFNCTSSASDWIPVTDPSVMTVTNLSIGFFTIPDNPVTLSNGHQLTIRVIQVSITAQPINNATSSGTLSQVVRVRNDEFS